MNQEIMDFFENNNHSVKEIVIRGASKGLTQSQVEQGMKRVHDRIQAGEKIKHISLAWEVWREAKACRSEAHVVNQSQVMALIESKKELQAEIDRFPEERSEWRDKVHFGLLCGVLINIYLIIGIVLGV